MWTKQARKAAVLLVVRKCEILRKCLLARGEKGCCVSNYDHSSMILGRQAAVLLAFPIDDSGVVVVNMVVLTHERLSLAVLA